MIDVTSILASEKNCQRLITAGFKPKYLWRIKTGRGGVSGDTLIKMEHILHISEPVKAEFSVWSPYPNKLFYYMQVKKIDTSTLVKKTALSSETIRKLISGAILPGKSALRLICRALYLSEGTVFPYYDDHIKQRQKIGVRY